MTICSFAGFESLNGANLRAFHLANEMIRRGVDVTFITPSRSHAESCRKRFGVEAVDVGLEFDRFSSSRLKLYPIYALRARKKVDAGSDIVFGQSLPSALAVRMSKTRGRKVVDYVDLWSEYWVYAHPSFEGRMVYRCVRMAERYSLKVDTVFTITREIKRMLETRGCPARKIKIIRDGVDTSMFRPLRVKPGFYDKYGLDRKAQYAIYQGGIAAHDGVQFLVDAAPLVLDKNPDMKFLIVGRGDYLGTLKRKVYEAGMGKAFIFTGWVPYEDMPSFMNASCMNIVPIPDAPATRGVVTLKLFEAMACRVPTVIGDLPGVKEHVRDGETACLVRSEDREQLAGAINRLAEDKDLSRRISRAGLKMVGAYDWRLIAKDMADLILS